MPQGFARLAHAPFNEGTGGAPLPFVAPFAFLTSGAAGKSFSDGHDGGAPCPAGLVLFLWEERLIAL